MTLLDPAVNKKIENRSNSKFKTVTVQTRAKDEKIKLEEPIKTSDMQLSSLRTTFLTNLYGKSDNNALENLQTLIPYNYLHIKNPRNDIVVNKNQFSKSFQNSRPSKQKKEGKINFGQTMVQLPKIQSQSITKKYIQERNHVEEIRYNSRKPSVIMQRCNIERKGRIDKVVSPKSSKNGKFDRFNSRVKNRKRVDELKSSSFYLYNRSPVSLYVGKEYQAKMVSSSSGMIKSFYR